MKYCSSACFLLCILGAVVLVTHVVHSTTGATIQSKVCVEWCYVSHLEGRKLTEMDWAVGHFTGLCELHLCVDLTVLEPQS